MCRLNDIDDGPRESAQKKSLNTPILLEYSQLGVLPIVLYNVQCDNTWKIIDRLIPLLLARPPCRTKFV